MSYLLRLVIGVLLLAVLAETVAHFVIKSEIVASVVQHDPGAQVVTAGVGIPVLPDLLERQKIPDVTVSARHVSLSNVVADKVTTHIFGLKLRGVDSLNPTVSHIDSVDLTAMFTEQDLAPLAPKNVSFTFGQDSVTLRGLGSSLTGTFEIRPPAQLVFVPQGAHAAGLAASLSIAFKVAPLSVCIQSVKLTPGTLTVTCHESNPTSADYLPHP